jgi:hypothetical protein
MTIEEWKALPYPGPSSEHATARCSYGPAGAAASDPQGESAKQSTAVEVCAYVAPEAEDEAFPLMKTFLARSPTYYFGGGRLSKIEFHTSIDAFNDVMALLEAKYGPASQTLRDDVRLDNSFDLPRVKKIWRQANGSIQLVDPSSAPAQLEVQFTAR